MKELLSHLDELNEHIRNLDDEIDRFMKPEEHEAAAKIQDVPGIGPTSAQAIISVIGTDMSRFPTDRHISSWAGLCPGNNESAGKRRSGKTRKGLCFAHRFWSAHIRQLRSNPRISTRNIREFAHIAAKNAPVWR